MPRELIDTGNNKRYVRRDDHGRFKESDDVGRSLAQDQKRDFKTKPEARRGRRGRPLTWTPRRSDWGSAFSASV